MGASKVDFNVDWSSAFDQQSSPVQNSQMIDPFATADPFATNTTTSLGSPTTSGVNFDPFGTPAGAKLATSASGFGEDNWAASAVVLSAKTNNTANNNTTNQAQNAFNDSTNWAAAFDNGKK